MYRVCIELAAAARSSFSRNISSFKASSGFSGGENVHFFTLSSDGYGSSLKVWGNPGKWPFPARTRDRGSKPGAVPVVPGQLAPMLFSCSGHECS